MREKNELRLRKCVSCRNMVEKKNLIRIVKDSASNVFIDNTFKANGRGAYICKNKDCIDKAFKYNALSRSLKIEIDGSLYQRILEEIEID